MSDAALPTVAEVRAAAEAVKEALDRHLAAVERRTGDEDPDVYAAFNELAAAAEEYDELLYDRYDEVTPFEIPAPEDGVPYTGPAEPAAFSVLIRRDYAVVEPPRLIAQAERVAAHDREAELDHDGGTAGALGVLFGEYEPDEIASRYKEFGLEEGDSTLWIAASEEAAEPGEWLNSPFGHTDPEDVMHRFDVSSVFDEETDEFGEVEDEVEDEGADEGETAWPGLTPA
ncbi:hypothetical protein OHB39_14820 [Streptomyces sp. NBC_00047]|uniref:hypothetical protein n=1 Tax=Streptomyces sp. NBC_00047 TaxID=2975627 RepID=UPI002251193F|nr:hypothetical protein [Streptomyces sp. NBC_00047]MCX5608838.1 hypothetical protein [Streptomyces sp. NBC_00047]